MRLSVFYLIKGECNRYIQRLTREVGPKFGENYLVENPLPSHITLKSPFIVSSSKKIEKVIEEFVKRQKKSEIIIRGFGNFDRFVAFLKPTSIKPVLKIQKGLVNKLEEAGIKPHPFDKKFHPHSTIAYGNKKETFDKIWDYLQTLEKPEFKLSFDNISLMKKVGKRWKVYREFKLK